MGCFKVIFNVLLFSVLILRVFIFVFFKVIFLVFLMILKNKVWWIDFDLGEVICCYV